MKTRAIRKIIAILMVLVMLAGILPVQAFAAYDRNTGQPTDLNNRVILSVFNGTTFPGEPNTHQNTGSYSSFDGDFEKQTGSIFNPVIYNSSAANVLKDNVLDDVIQGATLNNRYYVWGVFDTDGISTYFVDGTSNPIFNRTNQDKMLTEMGYSNPSQYEILWYVAKFQTSDTAWHIDGIVIPVNTYSVNYYGNGNTGGGAPVGSIDLANNSTYTILGNSGSGSDGNLTRVVGGINYTFTGWNTKADGTGTAYAAGQSITLNETTAPNGTLSLYAQWRNDTRYKATVRLYLDDVLTDVGALHADTGLFISKDGSTFLPLTKESTGTYSYSNIIDSGSYSLYHKHGSSAYEHVASYAVPIHNADGVLEVRHYTINYHTPEGSLPSNNEAYRSIRFAGNSETITTDIPVRDGYVFRGWNTVQDGSGTMYQPGDVINGITHRYDLYAQWEKTVNVSVTVTLKNADNAPDSMSARDLRTVLTRRAEGTSGDYAEVNGSTVNTNVATPAANSTVTYTYTNRYENLDPAYEYNANVLMYNYKLVSKSVHMDGDTYHVEAVLEYDPAGFDLTVNVDATAITDSQYVPKAVDTKVNFWNSVWTIITEHTNSSMDISVDGTAKTGSDKYHVLGFKDASNPYYYRAIPTGIDVGTETLPVTVVSGKENQEYTAGPYKIVVDVTGGGAPTSGELHGAFPTNSGSSITQNGTITLKISMNAYNVTFKANGSGATVKGNATYTESNIYRVPALTGYNPNWDGLHVFEGWYYDANENGTIDAGEPKYNGGEWLAKDITLIAKWKEPLTISGTVTANSSYILNGNTVNVPEGHRVTQAVVILEEVGILGEIASTPVSFTYSGSGSASAAYSFSVPDDGRNYEVIISDVTNYTTGYDNEPIDNAYVVLSHAETDGSTANDALFAGDSTAVVNVELNFAPESYLQQVVIDADEIGAAFRPTGAEAVLYSSNADHNRPPEMISQHYSGGMVIQLNEDIDGDSHFAEGASYEYVWKYYRGSTRYAYTFGINKLYGNVAGVFDNTGVYDLAAAPYIITYSPSAAWGTTGAIGGHNNTGVLKATLQPKSYSVTFDLNAGGDSVTGMPASPATHKWSYETKLTANPVREGYTFKGWSCSVNGVSSNGGEITISAAVAQDVTLVAQWEQNKYTVTYHNISTDRPATANIPANVADVIHGSTVTLTPATLTETAQAEKWTFAGWYLDAALTSGPVTELTNVTENQDVYAKWTLNSYNYTVEYYRVNTVGTAEAAPFHTDTFTVPYGTVISSVDDKCPSGYAPATELNQNIPLTVGAQTSANIIKIYYAVDSWDAGDNTLTGGDNVPDYQQAVIEFKNSDSSKGSVFPAEGSSLIQVFNLPESEGEYKGTEIPKSVRIERKLGYLFDNWHNSSDAFVEDPFVPHTLSGGDHIIYTAKWKSFTGCAYDVRYYEIKNGVVITGKPIHPLKPVIPASSASGTVIPVSTEYNAAAVIDGFTLHSSNPAMPDGTITLQEGQVPTIDLYYTRNSYDYTVEYYLINEKYQLVNESMQTVAAGTPYKTATISGALYGDIISSVSSQCPASFVQVRAENLPLTVTSNTANNVIKVFYALDVWNDAQDELTGGDGIADYRQAVIKFENEDPSKGSLSGSLNQVFTLAVNDNKYYSEVEPAIVTPVPGTAFIFDAWYKDGSTAAPFVDHWVNGGDVLTYTAKWTPTYTLTFNSTAAVRPDAASTTIPAPVSGIVHGNGVNPLTPASTVATVDSLGRIGTWTFDGWYENSDLSGSAVTSLTNITADKNVYAKWTFTPITITYHNTASVRPATASIPATKIDDIYSSSITLTAATTTEASFGSVPGTWTFDGWYLDENFAGSPVVQLTNITTNQNVYAKWTFTPNSYTITYHNDSTSKPATANIPANITVTHGNHAILTPATLTEAERIKWTFAGWYLTADFSGDPVDSFTNITENKHVYAKWTINKYTYTVAAYLVNKNAVVGTSPFAVETLTADYGTKIVETDISGIISAKKPVGYTFDEDRTENLPLTVSHVAADNVIRIYYAIDIWGDTADSITTGDNIPDYKQAVIEFRNSDVLRGTISPVTGGSLIQVFTLAQTNHGGQLVYRSDVEPTSVHAFRKTGYIFDAWYKTDNKGSAEIKSDDPFVIHNLSGGDHITYTAKWDIYDDLVYMVRYYEKVGDEIKTGIPLHPMNTKRGDASVGGFQEGSYIYITEAAAQPYGVALESTFKINNIEGFEYAGSSIDSTPLRISSTQENYIDLYYTRTPYNYRVEYHLINEHLQLENWPDGTADTVTYGNYIYVVNNATAPYGNIVDSVADKCPTGYVEVRTENLPLTISNKEEDNTITVFYAKDVWNDANNELTGGDGIPDYRQAVIHFVNSNSAAGNLTGSTTQVFTLSVNGNEYKADVMPTIVTATPADTHNFDAWYDSLNNHTAPFVVHLMRGGDEVTYTAKWTPNAITYSVTYTDGVAGSEVFPDQVTSNLNYGDATPAFVGTPSRTGYDFTGWSPAVSPTVTGTVTYVAQWTEQSGGGWLPPQPPVMPTTGTAKLLKVDASDNSTVLADVIFELHKQDGTLVGTYTTDASGMITVSDLEPGDYYWLEVLPAEGYSVDSTHRSFTVAAGSTAELTVTNSRTPIPEVFTGDHYGYIIGYEDGMVHPEKNISRAEVATIFFRLLDDDVRSQRMTKENSFPDVNEGDWFNVAVSTMYSLGIIGGYEDGTFRPNAPITRAEFAAIASRFDLDGDASETIFEDIYEHWGQREINIAANNGWVLGYEDGTFKPDSLVTRAEAMTMVNRVLQRIPQSSADLLPGMIQWPDNRDTGKWYYLVIQEATNSHHYDRKDNGYEKWTELREPRDWEALQK